MPSPEQEAELERLLRRAAQECEGRSGIWFGEGLPQALRSRIEAAGRTVPEQPAEIAFMEVSAVTPEGGAVTGAVPPDLNGPVIGLSASTREALGGLIRTCAEARVPIKRLICPVAVLDFSEEGIRVREVCHGLTAADVQESVATPLWSGPDLKELGSH